MFTPSSFDWVDFLDLSSTQINCPGCSTQEGILIQKNPSVNVSSYRKMPRSGHKASSSYRPSGACDGCGNQPSQRRGEPRHRLDSRSRSGRGTGKERVVQKAHNAAQKQRVNHHLPVVAPAFRHGLAGAPGCPEAEKNDKRTQDIANAIIGFEKRPAYFPQSAPPTKSRTTCFPFSLDRFPASFIVCFLLRQTS